MQNKYFKSAIISSAIAVTTGVVLFGINATFGAPTYQPPGADVSPTFTGLNVTGPIANSGGALNLNDSTTITGDATVTGNMDLKGSVRNSTNLPFAINDAEGLDVQNGSIKNTTANNGGAVKIDDSLDITNTLSTNAIKSYSGGTISVTGDLDLQNGFIKNTTANNFGLVSIKDHTVINGDLGVSGAVLANRSVVIGVATLPPSDTNGLLEVVYRIINPAANDPVKIDDSLDVTGAISNSAGDVTINDNLKINNELNVVQNAVFSDEVEMSGPLILRGNTQIWDDGKGYVFSVATPMEVAGMISNPNGTNPVTINDAQGLKITQTGSGTGTLNALTLTAGNQADKYGSNQILFGYDGTSQYMHAIKSRHHSGQTVGNALDFYVWDQSTQSATPGAVGTKRVMTLDGNGYVGIGTNAPGSKLHVSGSNTAGERMGLLIDNIATTGTNLASVTLKAAGVYYGDIFGGKASPNYGLVNGITISPALNTQDIGFRTGNQVGAPTPGQAMIIKSTGKVGIGTNDPLYALDVRGDFMSSGDIIAYTKDIVLMGMNSVIRSSGSSPVTFGSNIYTKNIDVNGAAYLHNGNVALPLSVKDDLKVTGKVTSTVGFGTYTQYWSPAGKSVANNSSGSLTATCPAGEILVSCGFLGVTPTRMIKDGTRCYLDVTNTSGAPQWMDVQVMCLNPNI